MDEANICTHVFVFAWEDDWEFCFLFDRGINQSAADADDAALVDEGVVSDEGGVFHCHFLVRIGMKDVAVHQILPFFWEIDLLSRGEN